ncbi:caspase family protein [Streptomyces lavendulocolor]|uniref:caspase family protein n=1 Tax=Streptomyces lavendulocolor TaxID=67316 RepID=UPI003C2E79D8
MDDSRYALIIANDDYQEGGLQKLTSPAADAEALAEVLGNPRIGGFQVNIVRNEPSYVVRSRIEDFFAERRTGDTLLLHFSCHGLKSESGELFFAAPDTRPKRLKATGIASGFVQDCMADTRAGTTVLFLDCCYGGAFSPGTVARAAGDVHALENFAGEKLGRGGRGWAVVTASDSMEYAFEGARLADEGHPKPSIFTSALVSGLATGEADRNEDGRVSLNELYDYVHNRVVQENRNQNPRCKSDLQGDLYLARSDRRRLVPQPLPERFRAALASEEVLIRLGAVTELRSRMQHTDPAIAAGAHTALTEVARNDIQTVAEEAAHALDAVRITPDPADLRFDPVYQHAVPPLRHVRLLGPPLARACTPRTESDRLHATPSGDGLDVTLDTADPGPVTGDILLKGYAGEAVVHVEAEVRAAADTVPAEPPPEPPHHPPVWDPPPPPRPPEPPPRPNPPHQPTGLKAYRAPAIAVAALAAAIASLAIGIKAAVEAARLAQAGETWVNLQDHLARESTRDLVVCLVLAVVSLILLGASRYDLRTSPGLYGRQRAAATSLLNWSAKVLALPVCVLAVLAVIAVMIAARAG